MNVQETILPQVHRLRVAPILSPDARRRLRWMDYFEQDGRNVSPTCRHFDISRETFYRWWRRYDPRRVQTLEDDRGTRRPRQVRQPQTPPELETRIGVLRERYSCKGIANWRCLRRREGWTISHATIRRNSAVAEMLPRLYAASTSFRTDRVPGRNVDPLAPGVQRDGRRFALAQVTRRATYPHGMAPRIAAVQACPTTPFA